MLAGVVLLEKPDTPSKDRLVVHLPPRIPPEVNAPRAPETRPPILEPVIENPVLVVDELTPDIPQGDDLLEPSNLRPFDSPTAASIGVSRAAGRRTIAPGVARSRWARARSTGSRSR